MKRIVIFALFVVLLPVCTHAVTWTYVQESVITSCANNTSSCSTLGGGVIPTLANSVWIFGISTTNDVTATVSGGGATWTECAACTTFLSGFRRNRVFYALGGTAGSANFSITLFGGNSGSSFAVTFVEVLPPTGTTPQFDVGGATSSSTCSGTCTGVGLTLGVGSTDVVVQFMNRIAPASWNSWPSPYLSLPNGDGIHLNASGTETAPVVNVASGTGSVFSAIAFKVPTFTPPAAGPISIVNFSDTDPTNGLTGLNCSPTCASFSIPTTGVGHLLYLESGNASGTFISSVSGGGTWVVPSQCAIKGGQSTNNAISCAYVLSSTAGVSSLSISMTGTGNTLFALFEVATASGVFALDTVGSATNGASFQPSGAALTLSGSAIADVVFQAIRVFGGTSSVSYFPYLRSCQSGCGPGFYNGGAAVDAYLNAVGTVPTPQWANQQNNSTVVTGIAFSVVNPVINAASCSSTDVQSAFNSVAVDNTTVILPTCLPAANVQWSSTVTYNKPFSVVVQGQGSVVSSDGFGNPATYNDQTAIFDTVANSSVATLVITTTANKSFRVTGVSFLFTSAQVNARNTGIVSVDGNSHSFRMDHNHFKGGIGFRMLNIASGNVWGVIDHNLFDMANGTNVNMIEVNGANYNASGDSFGDASWTDIANFGTANFLFAENNTFTTSAAGGIRSFDIQQGGRFVFRRNTSVNAPLQTHAIGHDGPTFRDRGPRAYEVYSNSITFPTGGPFAFMTDYEGGTSLYWGNTVSGFNSFLNLDYRRATGFTYSQIQPPNGWGYCGSLQTGPNGTGPSVWDQSIDNTGWGCLDGTGRGNGDLLTGSTWPNVTDQLTGTQTWPKQVPEPMYVWANTSTTPTYVGTAQSDTSSVNNRDYFVELPNANNAATFNGTAGIGNGASLPTVVGAYTNAPACSYSVGYWQTTASTLFVCKATWGAMDQWFPMTGQTIGATLTTGALAGGVIGPTTNWTLNPSTPTGFTFASSQGSMGGSLTLGGVTYPVGTPTEAISLNDANNFTYATGGGSFSGKNQMVTNGFITPGYANSGSSGLNIDFIVIQDNGTTPPGFAVMQMNNGQPCYCMRIEANPGGATTRSANITMTPGHRYSYSFLWDEVNGLAQLALFDPSNNFAQVGSTVSVAQVSTVVAGSTGIGQFRFGNAETGTSTGTTFFENMMLDWTNHVFPNVPTPTWTAYYTPFTYPHPLDVGSGSGTPAVQFSSSTLSFANQLVGTSSVSQTVTLTNSGTAVLAITSISINGLNPSSWSQSNNCGASLGVGSNCAITVTFSPVTPGPLPASVSVASNSPASPDIVTMSGFGLTSVIIGKGSISGNATIKVNP